MTTDKIKPKEPNFSAGAGGGEERRKKKSGNNFFPLFRNAGDLLVGCAGVDQGGW